jgi:hypothetical protein
MALNVTRRLRMTRMTTGERGDAETVTPRSEGGGRKRASNGTSSAPYPTWDTCSSICRFVPYGVSILVKVYDGNVQSTWFLLRVCADQEPIFPKKRFYLCSLYFS